ncbi:MAG TPA: universal stress protein [Gaiellaceae bacterium]|nr:universal stress protein [Gaiellaceae bacterium]
MSTFVVGVDGSAESVAALRHAIREARLHGAGVKAVAVWHVPTAAYGGAFAPATPDPHEFERLAAGTLESALAAVADELEGVPLASVVREGDPAQTLLEEAEGAEQLVVGCAHHGLLGRLVHHSVSGECSREARCPVTVVHGREGTA